MLKILRQLFAKPPKTNVIVLGTDFEHYQLAEEWLKQGTYHILAFIDEEPWNHKTQLHGAPLKYPSELTALCQKHQVDVVVGFSEQALQLTEQQVEKLHQLGVEVRWLEDQQQ